MLSKGMTEFRVGVFVTIGLILAMVVIFMIGGEHRLFERYYTLYANFKNIAGLRIGAPVQLAGLRVGFVDKIKFPTDLETREITVSLNVKKDFQSRIRLDSVATVETQGLLGDKYIYVSVGSEVQPIIADKGVLPSKDTTSIFSLAEKAGGIMDNIGKASESLNEMLGSIKGTKGEGDLKATIRSVKNTVEQIEKGKGLAHSLIYDPKGAKLIDDLSDVISSDLKGILGTIRRGDGSLGLLINDPALYDDLRSLFGRANRNNLLRAVIRSTLSENDRQMLKE